MFVFAGLGGCGVRLLFALTSEPWTRSLSVAVCFCKRGTFFEWLTADGVNFYDPAGTGWVVCVCGGNHLCGSPAIFPFTSLIRTDFLVDSARVL